MRGLIQEGSGKWDRDERLILKGDVQAKIRYFCPVKQEEVEIRGQVYDISEGGASLLTFQDELPVDSEIHLAFQLPLTASEATSLIKATGKVRRTKPSGKHHYHNSVEFLDLSKTDRFTIRGYITLKKMGESFL